MVFLVVVVIVIDGGSGSNIAVSLVDVFIWF